MRKTYPKPRNTLVMVRELSRKPDEQVGRIILPESNSRMFMRAEIVALGPGMATNGRDQTELHDLQVGQVVWIKSHSQRGPTQFMPNGQQLTFEGETLWLFEQTEVMVILHEPGELVAPTPATAESNLIQA